MRCTTVEELQADSLRSGSQPAMPAPPRGVCGCDRDKPFRRDSLSSSRRDRARPRPRSGVRSAEKTANRRVRFALLLSRLDRDRKVLAVVEIPAYEGVLD